MQQKCLWFRTKILGEEKVILKRIQTSYVPIHRRLSVHDEKAPITLYNFPKSGTIDRDQDEALLR